MTKGSEMATQELLVPEQQSLSPRMTMLEFAMRQNASIEQLEKLMELQERYDANEAKKSFIQAMAAFKAQTVRVVKDKINPQYQSKYVSLGNLVNTVTPVLSQFGLSIRWDIDQGQAIKVTCIVTHCAGHSESVSMVCPPDGSGAKNPIQQIKSAITYAKACTFESICGLASTDANIDDDGNGFSQPQAQKRGMDDLNDHVEYLANARNKEELVRLYEVAYKKASEAQDTDAKKKLVAARDARRKELQ